MMKQSHLQYDTYNYLHQLYSDMYDIYIYIFHRSLPLFYKLSKMQLLGRVSAHRIIGCRIDPS